MELPSHLIRKAFIVLVGLVGLLLIVNLPPAEEIGTSPTSPLVSFSVDHRVTTVHKNLKKGHHAEILGDSAVGTSGRAPAEHFRLALEHFRRAGELSERYKSGGYLTKLVRDAVTRVESKLEALR